MKDPVIANYLLKLVQLSKAVTAKMSEELVIRFDIQTVEQKEVQEFVYNENGASCGRSSHSFKQINNWTKGCFDAYRIVAPSSEFLALDNVVKENYPVPYQSNIVPQYTFQLFYILFKSGGAADKIKDFKQSHQPLNMDE